MKHISTPANGAADVELYCSTLHSTPEPEERHANFELIYVESGGTHMLVGTQPVESHPGSIFFIPPDSFHRHGDPSRHVTWFLRFHVDAVPGQLRRLLAKLALLPPKSRCYVVPATNRLPWEERFRYLRYELYARPSRDSDAVRVILRSVLLDLAELAHVERAESMRRQEVVNTVFRFIDERYRLPIGLRDVAAAVQRSPAYLTDLVRRETGKPIHQWIADRRMFAARMLLAETDLPVSAVANEVGFSDASYFSRQFSKVSGKTPQAWRIGARRGGGFSYDDATPWSRESLSGTKPLEEPLARELSDAFAQLTDRELIVRHAVTKAFDVLKPTVSQFVEHSAREKRWYQRFGIGSNAGVALPEATDEDGVFPLVLTGQTIITQDLAHSPSPLLRSFATLGFGCSMVAPIRLGSECFGCIRVLQEKRHMFSERGRVLLATIGSLTGLALRGLVRG